MHADIMQLDLIIMRPRFRLNHIPLRAAMKPCATYFSFAFRGDCRGTLECVIERGIRARDGDVGGFLFDFF